MEPAGIEPRDKPIGTEPIGREPTRMDQQQAPHGQQWVRSTISRFERPLLLYAQRLLHRGDADRARDVVQETFVQLCDDPPADVNGHLAEWLYAVCRSKAMDVRRKEKRNMTMLDTAEQTIASDSAGPEALAEKHESTSRLLRLLAHLPDSQQEAIRLKFQHGMSYRQISTITGHSQSNVGFLIHTGLKTLRARMR
jgi:RNA polymerase sigma-70 factor (ECF subfamily)